MKNLGQLMKQAQAMQSRMAEMQAELERVEMTGHCGFAIIARGDGCIRLAGVALRIQVAELNERRGVAGFCGLAEQLPRN